MLNYFNPDNMKKLALLVDFTGVCQLAMEHAALITRQSLSQLVLLHVAPLSEQKNDKDLKNKIREFASILEKEGVPFAIQIDYGDFFGIIGNSIRNLDVDLIVVGTHGIKGISQDFEGSAVLRLIRQLNTPALIVQGHCQTPMEGYLNILVPLVGKIKSNTVMNGIVKFAEVFKSKFHFLGYYNIENRDEIAAQNEELTQLVNDNFESSSELEECSVYTSSFSKSIVQYADIEEIQLIVLLINESEENYFNSFDKENILLNRLGKAILCV